MRSIGLVGIPANSAGTRDGVARAPAALRAAGLSFECPVIPVAG